jgi:hypothetical protein
LRLLDGTMASMAELMGLRITDYDTENTLTGSGVEGRSASRRPRRAAPEVRDAL